MALGQGPCPKPLKLYTKLKSGSGTALSDFKILLMGSDEKDGRQNGLVVGQEGRKPLSLYKSECAATYTVEGDTTPGSSFGGKILGTR